MEPGEKTRLPDHSVTGAAAEAAHRDDSAGDERVRTPQSTTRDSAANGKNELAALAGPGSAATIATEPGAPTNDALSRGPEGAPKRARIDVEDAIFQVRRKYRSHGYDSPADMLRHESAYADLFNELGLHDDFEDEGDDDEEEGDD